MNYYLCHGVYIVQGVARSAIYDFNRCKLYSINVKTFDLITRLTGGHKAKISGQSRDIVALLLDNKILTLEKKLANLVPDIKNLEHDELKKYAITLAWVEVTKKCNLHCRHCYEDSSRDSVAEMEISNFRYAVDRIVEAGIKNIQLIGGEPFILGSKLHKMLEYCRNKFDSVNLFTNGILLNEKDAKFLKSLQIKVALSIYSYNATEHDKMTGFKGSYVQTNNAIRLLKKHGVAFRVATVAHKDIQIGESTDFCFKISNVDLPRMCGRADLGMYSKAMLKRKIITKRAFNDPLDYFKVITNINGHNCFSKRIYVDTRLDIFPCVMERDFCHGNLRDGRINDILKIEIITLTKDRIDGCRNCEYRYGCFDCRPDRLNQNKYAKPWYCSYSPQKGEWIEPAKFISQLLI
ncbi:radical SAM protein [Candidatus Parcubacteria bacterium]|nr:radical SAM protein [Candidatus Parcubacteria bacterium]